MKPSIASQQEYESYIYALPSLHSEIEKSTLILLPIGRYLAKITGEVSFKQNFRMKVLQVVDFGRSEIFESRHCFHMPLQRSLNFLEGSRRA